ncbi:MAG: CU044_2847 family protein [Pseudonocardiaceae bacterium]
MPELAKFSLEGGGSVHVDVDEVPRVAPVSRHGRILDAKATFETALGEVRDAAVVALTEFRTMARQPDEVEITFGVRLDAEVGAVIAKTGMAGNFEVKLTWRSNVQAAPDGAASLPEAGELQRPDPVS